MSADNVLFSKSAMRALLNLDKSVQERVNQWIDELSKALREGELPGKNADDSGAGDGEPIAKSMDLSPYGGPFFGVNLDEQVHLVCAFTDKECAVLALNAPGRFDP